MPSLKAKANKYISTNGPMQKHKLAAKAYKTTSIRYILIPHSDIRGYDNVSPIARRIRLKIIRPTSQWIIVFLKYVLSVSVIIFYDPNVKQHLRAVSELGDCTCSTIYLKVIALATSIILAKNCSFGAPTTEIP